MPGITSAVALVRPLLPHANVAAAGIPPRRAAEKEVSPTKKSPHGAVSVPVAFWCVSSSSSIARWVLAARKQLWLNHGDAQRLLLSGLASIPVDTTLGGSQESRYSFPLTPTTRIQIVSLPILPVFIRLRVRSAVQRLARSPRCWGCTGCCRSRRGRF